ncbi:MAG: HAMP domain-containing histidine kinase [Candidatus Dormibacteraeota bacterium]|nr:HAMP domain-containing histidine kinase [Candidatus Dormibacteraeota bacterium]
MSLRLRLALFGAAVVALTLVLFGALLYALLAHGVMTTQDDALRGRAGEAVAALGNTPDLTPRPPVVPADLRTSTEIFVEVFDPSWRLVYTTGLLNGAAPSISQGLRGAASHGGFDTEGGLRLYARQFRSGFVVTGQSTRVPQSNLSGVLGFLIISGVPTLIAALAASWLVAGRALKPLKNVAGAAGEIGRARDFGRRLPDRRSRDEVALLSTSFNQMLEQLQDSFESQRRFVADASHELRTPLTTIQGNAGLLARGPALSEGVRRAAAADIAAETARMTRLVDRMLTLARADAGLSLDLAAIELGPVVGEVCRQAQTVHVDRPLQTAIGDARVAGDVDAIRQLTWILLDNAFRHARSHVDVTLSSEGDWARLTVSDDGAGIAPAERERVFERFYRADRARSEQGAGLGLSIARWIVKQHRGRILAGEASGGGAAMYVDLPLLRRS